MRQKRTEPQDNPEWQQALFGCGRSKTPCHGSKDRRKNERVICLPGCNIDKILDTKPWEWKTYDQPMGRRRTG